MDLRDYVIIHNQLEVLNLVHIHIVTNKYVLSVIYVR
jgi:hypothetical protein